MLVLTYFMYMQARNQEFFRAGDFSLNQDTSINIHLQHKKERPRREKICGFLAKKLKNFILNEKFYPMDDHNHGIFSPNQGTFFQVLKKGRGDLPPSSLQLRACTYRGKLLGETTIFTIARIALIYQFLNKLNSLIYFKWVILVHDTRSNDARFMHKLCKHAFFIQR